MKIFLLILTIPLYCFSSSDSISCSLNYSASLIDSKVYNKVQHSSGKQEVLTVTFDGIHSNSPTLRGNNGSSKLVVSNGNNLKYFIETTSSGSIVVWTYYPESKKITCSKQYEMALSPFALIMLGQCKDL